MAALLVGAANVHAADLAVSRGAYTLHADIKGEGATTVVFESGFGQGGRVWTGVIDGLGADCRCVTYARAGIEASGTDGQPKSIKQHVADLAAVIDATAPAGGSVVLVGHSYGGLLATEYAREHPERLRALVLVDPATMGQRHAYRQADVARVDADDAKLLKMLPPTLAADYQVLTRQLDAPEAITPATLPDVPVALLTSTRVEAEPLVFEETAAGKAIWKSQHALLFTAFARGNHRYVATGHNVQREDPLAVVEGIRSVWGSAKP